MIFALDMIHMVLGTVGGAVLLCEPLTRLIQVELTYEMCRVVVSHTSAAADSTRDVCVGRKQPPGVVVRVLTQFDGLCWMRRTVRPVPCHAFCYASPLSDAIWPKLYNRVIAQLHLHTGTKAPDWVESELRQRSGFHLISI